MENKDDNTNSMFNETPDNSDENLDDLADLLGVPSGNHQEQSENSEEILSDDLKAADNISKPDNIENSLPEETPEENNLTAENNAKDDDVSDESNGIAEEESNSSVVEGDEELSKENTEQEKNTAEDTPVQSEETHTKDLGVATYIEDSKNDNYDNENSNQLVTVRPVKFKEFEAALPNRKIKKNYDIMQDIQMHVSVELGRTKATIKDVIDLTQGSIVELDKIAGEQVEIYVNDKIVAKGEVIVIEDKFGVRVTSTNLQKAAPTL